MNQRPVQPLSILRKRPEFLAVAASGRKWVAPGLILQMLPGPTAGLRYGLTASGKIGNAVIRNRARRRLRALAVDVLPRHAVPGHDYVIIARAVTGKRDFAALRQDLVAGLKKLGTYHD